MWRKPPKKEAVFMKKVSLIFTLALAALCTTGCDAFSFINGETTPETQDDQGTTPAKPSEDEKGKEEETIEIEAILLQEDGVTFNIGETYQIVHDVWPQGAYDEVSYDSLNTAVATVSVDGLVTAVGEGSTKIKLTSIENTSVTEYFQVVVNTLPVTNYTVTFNANGGSGSMSQATTTGSTYVTPSCSFTKTNYTFNGWALNSPSGTIYNTGDTILNITSDITLYATWRDNTQPVTNYTVTFNANGGSGTMSSKTTTGSTYTTPACTFTYADHTFVEWALNSPTGTKYAANTTITGISANITLYATWEESGSGDDTYYAECAGLTGSALQAKLLSINKPKSKSYDWSRYEAADEAEDDSSCILSLYTRHNIKKNNHCGSYSWTTWNREHIWTQTAFPNSDTDNHNIFACEGKINGIRSNYIFDEGGDIVEVFGHVTECRYKSNTSFEPCDAAKGEVARAVMYGTVMYTYTMTDEIKSIELALKWHLQHPNTTRDTKRNKVVYGLQGNRNPFVDHPEYACKIWGNTNSATRSLCGM